MIKIDFWDLDDVEYLQYTDIDEAIEMILDGNDELPEKLEIYGYKRRKITNDIKFDASCILERILEDLDEEYGSPDSITDATEEMIKASERFIKKIYSKYDVWQCEIVKKEIIDVKKWIKKNRPDWIKEIESEV